MALDQINVGIIGTGWCGGIRANSCADNPLIDQLHIAEINPQRLEEVAKSTGAISATAEYEYIVKHEDIDAVFISATPETTHYPMAKECLLAGKHVFLEKPIALTLGEADELIVIANQRKLKFTIGYSQRFSPKYAYVKKCIEDGTIGEPVSALVSRHITRSLGKKITGRIKLSPASMEATHDLDFVLWCLAPARPIRVYAQAVEKVMVKEVNASDCMWITITMDNGVAFVVGAGWILPPGYPNFSTTWIEMVGSEGALLVDDSHKDVTLNTMKDGIQFPMSSMPGESVGHVFSGAMANETIHFVDAVARDRPVLVTPEEARQVMEVYIAADLSAERNEPVRLPLQEPPF